MSTSHRRPGRTVRARILSLDGGVLRARADSLATEEPLELRVHQGGAMRLSVVTMRTPGNDFELAAGYLLSEGVARGPDDIVRISYCVDRALGEEQRHNVVTVRLHPDCAVDWGPLQRAAAGTSACGVCGKASLEAVEARGLRRVQGGLRVALSTLLGLPEALEGAQGGFSSTGGMHAAARFDATGRLLALREDVGRHNAVDKLLGHALLEGALPLGQQLVWVSGRASFEIVQKCALAGVPVLCAVSAPSSLAVRLAERAGMTLVAFLRPPRLNVYAGAERIEDDSALAKGASPK